MPPSGPGWSPWQPVAGIPPLGDDVLAEILDGGQAFRWVRVSPVIANLFAPDLPAARTKVVVDRVEWLGQWADNLVRLRLDRNERLHWCGPCAIESRVAPAVASYFASGHDFDALTDTLPWRSDPHLARCLVAFHGLRILRQPFGETLLAFLCSATKQIIQIKSMVSLLATRHGALIDIGMSDRKGVRPELSRTRFHRLPTWAELAEAPEAKLRECQLGFRARYIAETARVLARQPGWLEETESLPYAAAKERLCSLPGVGEKLADCVLLFGAGRLEAFPVDVWILKTMARRYALDGWRPAQLAQFGRAHFGPLAGLAQQFLFAWERRHGKTTTETPRA